MSIEKYKDKIFKYAKEKGFTDCEIYFDKSKNLTIKAFNQAIDNFTSSETMGISFRGIYNDKMGYSYTEIMDEDSVKLIVDQAMENVKSIDSKDKELIHDGSGDYKELDLYMGEIEKIDIEEKLNYPLEIEKKLKEKENIIQTNNCTYGESIFEVSIFNTKGLNKSFKNDLAYLIGYAVASDKKNPKTAPKTGFSFYTTKSKNDIDIDYIVNEAHKKATSMLGAKSIKSGKYDIILENMVVNNIMGAFLPTILSAENVQKGRSLLKGKLEKQIANPKLTIYEDPHRPGSVNTSSFDAEGIATYKKDIISNGILKTYLHNMKTAYKDGVKSTGNGFKRGYQSPIMIRPTNMVIEKGNISFDKLLEKCGNGLLITNVAGLHSGANPISGDFSLMAEGLKIDNGKLGTPVEQFTISGNLFDLFNNIIELADDIKEGFPYFGSYFSPSMLIKSIDVAGSE